MNDRPTIAQMVEAIHVALCESSRDECAVYRGRCVRAAEAVTAIPSPRMFTRTDEFTD